MKRLIYAAPLALMLPACGGTPPQAALDEHAGQEEGHGEDHTVEEGVVTLTEAQIRAAGIEVVAVGTTGSGGALMLPATIEADPDGIQVVTAAIGGRVVALSRNLGETVRKGETLAVIESREAAQMQGEIEAASARLALARSNLAREQRLFGQKVSPEQDLIAARTAATEAGIALRLARQQLAATGRAGGGLNRVALPSPLSGQVIARSATPGQAVTADAELFRVANLTTVSIALSLDAADAARLRPGARVAVSGQGREGEATIRFISPVLDAQTRLVPAIATLDNRGGLWRVGEAVTAAVDVPVLPGARGIKVPQVAVQTLEGRRCVFVRTRTGFRAVPVRTGATSGDGVLVLEGLKGGERLAATGSFTLKAELGKGEAEHEH
ncbi:efflux RND transporter periplasmic adaptor subunit [Novosphingobium sp. AP12]|uniref:efflux RND transporter periplasmic adaptor subunit n=1 Tax=Novosphingobium sp. AP12 TaxID=1144305 RepID=UPI00027219F8|nr:efflux RND transporter periplasmic adaptor subunit [Novosphingobium sp. AP12]EJL27970.1 RND family efflux transporter, MFP subunit [Novosphingobium sp. AP12]